MQKQESANWSWRACKVAILHGHAGNVPDKIVFDCQRTVEGNEHVPLLFISFSMQNRTLNCQSVESDQKKFFKMKSEGKDESGCGGGGTALMRYYCGHNGILHEGDTNVDVSSSYVMKQE